MPDKPFSAREFLAKIASAHHGALNYAELAQKGISPADVLDFSSNVNPFGPPAGVADALLSADLIGYPDRESLSLRRLLAERHGAGMAQIVVGNGTAELIWLVCFAFLQAGDVVLQAAPTFGEYARCARLMGAEVVSVWAKESDGFKPNLGELGNAIEEHHPRLVFLCNPNNPTGQFLPGKKVQNLINTFPGTGFVIDEAYLPFIEDEFSVFSSDHPNLIVLRSLTKDYSLAGMRLGYLAAPQGLADAVAAARPAWNVSALAQAAGEAALRDESFIRHSVRRLYAAKAELVEGLKGFCYLPLPSNTPFFMMPVGDAAAFRERLLLDAHIQVRDCTSFGLPSYVRIAPRSPEDNQRLLDALAAQKK